MDRLRSFSLGEVVYTVFINAAQDLASAMRPSLDGDLAAMSGGIEGRLWQATADLADATLVQVDTATISTVDTGVSPAVLASSSIVWKDREVFGIFRGYAGANQRPGQANDYQFDAAGAPTLFWGYLGKGAYDGGGASAPSAGNPPVPAAGTSWAAEVSANLWLYVGPVDGKLYLYNNTGATIRTPTLWFFASAPTGKRP